MSEQTATRDTFMANVHDRLSHVEKQSASTIAEVQGIKGLVQQLDTRLQQFMTQSRPNMAAYGMGVLGLVGVLITIGTLAFSPVYRTIGTLEINQRDQRETLTDRGYMIGEFQAQLEHLTERNRQYDIVLADLAAAVSGMRENRFTKDDGYKLGEVAREDSRVITEQIRSITDRLGRLEGSYETHDTWDRGINRHE